MQGKRVLIAKDNLLKTKAEEMEKLVESNKEREDRLNSLLRESESKHSQQRSELQQMLEAEIQVCNEMKNECKKLTQQLQDSSEKARYLAMCQLLAARNNLLKERKILSQEVEFLRKQWISKATPSVPVTPVDTASHASTDDVEDKGETPDRSF
ncbi:hypothetical protein P5673_008154 [Acropora cervicornis]|uniref:Uncharacterized protein n=1 Tax=Acropora cervicornis TaxID=6130 RepID=A0AAD9QU06_ACRCE|nr:hypothetical protein P5673_008154 [Acropora cervicornis]